MRKKIDSLVQRLEVSYAVDGSTCQEAAQTIRRLSGEVENVRNANARMGGRLRQLYIAVGRGDLDEEWGRGGSSASRQKRKA